MRLCDSGSGKSSLVSGGGVPGNLYKNSEGRRDRYERGDSGIDAADTNTDAGI